MIMMERNQFTNLIDLGRDKVSTAAPVQELGTKVLKGNALDADDDKTQSWGRSVVYAWRPGVLYGAMRTRVHFIREWTMRTPFISIGIYQNQSEFK